MTRPDLVRERLIEILTQAGDRMAAIDIDPVCVTGYLGGDGRRIQVGPWIRNDSGNTKWVEVPDFVDAASEVLEGLNAAGWVELANAALGGSRSSAWHLSLQGGSLILAGETGAGRADAYHLSRREGVIRLEFWDYCECLRPHGYWRNAHVPVIPVRAAIDSRSDRYGAALTLDSRWRYEICRDIAAADRLALHLKRAAGELSRSGAALIGVAAADSRFNDAWDDENWRGVRIGTTAWSNSGYFKKPDSDLMQQSDEVRRAARIIADLEDADWGVLYTQAYGEVLSAKVRCLFLERGRVYFAFASSQGDCGAIYEVDSAGRLRWLGLAARFDWNFCQYVESTPLVYWVEVDALAATFKTGVQTLGPEFSEVNFYDGRCDPTRLDAPAFR